MAPTYMPMKHAMDVSRPCTNDCYAANSNAREAEIARNGGDWLSERAELKKAPTHHSYVNFVYDSTVPDGEYSVFVQAMTVRRSNSPNGWHNIGRLASKVMLPDGEFTKGFDSGAQIAVIPTTASLPAYTGELIRGATYTMFKNAPVVNTNGHRQLLVHGMK